MLTRSLFFTVGSVLVALAGLATDIEFAPNAMAQLLPGEFCLRQSAGVVGWVYIAGDQTCEWWAYVNGVYTWAGSSNTSSNRWKLEVEYIGATSWPSYTAWQSDVRLRAAAAGHTVKFEKHTVE